MKRFLEIFSSGNELSGMRDSIPDVDRRKEFFCEIEGVLKKDVRNHKFKSFFVFAGDIDEAQKKAKEIASTVFQRKDIEIRVTPCLRKEDELDRASW